MTINAYSNDSLVSVNNHPIQAHVSCWQAVSMCFSRLRTGVCWIQNMAHRMTQLLLRSRGYTPIHLDDSTTDVIQHCADIHKKLNSHTYNSQDLDILRNTLYHDLIELLPDIPLESISDKLYSPDTFATNFVEIIQTISMDLPRITIISQTEPPNAISTAATNVLLSFHTIQNSQLIHKSQLRLDNTRTALYKTECLFSKYNQTIRQHINKNIFKDIRAYRNLLRLTQIWRASLHIKNHYIAHRDVQYAKLHLGFHKLSMIEQLSNHDLALEGIVHLSEAPPNTELHRLSVQLDHKQDVLNNVQHKLSRDVDAVYLAMVDFCIANNNEMNLTRFLSLNERLIHNLIQAMKKTLIQDNNDNIPHLIVGQLTRKYNRAISDTLATISHVYSEQHPMDIGHMSIYELYLPAHTNPFASAEFKQMLETMK